MKTFLAICVSALFLAGFAAEADAQNRPSRGGFNPPPRMGGSIGNRPVVGNRTVVGNRVGQTNIYNTYNYGNRGGGWYGGPRPYGSYWNGNNAWVPMVAGLATGLVLGAASQPRTVYAAPAQPVYSAPPSTVYASPPPSPPTTVYASPPATGNPVNIVPTPGYAPPSGPEFVQPGQAEAPLWLAGPAYIDPQTNRVCQDYNSEGQYPNGFHYRMTRKFCDTGTGQFVEIQTKNTR